MATLKHHHLRFEKAPVKGDLQKWESLIGKINGVCKVRINPYKKDIFVEYDLLKCTEEKIEKILIETGFILDEGYLERVRRGWIHYTEGNETDALKASSHSCCELPEVEEGSDNKKQ